MVRFGSSSTAKRQATDLAKEQSSSLTTKTPQHSTRDQSRYSNEPELSPGSRPSSSTPTADDSQRSSIAPWEQDEATSPMQKPTLDLTTIKSTESFPSPNWDNLSMTSDRFGQSPPPASNSFHPSLSASDANDYSFSHDDRRPSIASATTTSSETSAVANGRSSTQKLKGFFGEDIPDSSSPPPIDGDGSQRSNHNSNRNNLSKPIDSPHAQPPSSDVTPWMFQEPEDPQSTGDTSAARRDAAGIEKNRRQSSFPLKSNHGHKFSIHRHRHQKSTDDAIPENDQRSPTRHASLAFPSRNTPQPTGDMLHRDSVWTPSSSTPQKPSADDDTESAKSIGENGSSQKRSLLQKLRGKKKDDKDDSESLKPSSSTNLTIPNVAKPAKDGLTKVPTSSPNSAQASKPPEDTGLFRTSTRSSIAQPSQKKEKDHHSRMPFRSRRSDAPTIKDPNTATVDSNKNESLWDLDTDLSHMEGIVNKSTTGTPLVQKTNPFDDPSFFASEPVPTPSWDAPDSWAIKKAADDPGNKTFDKDEVSTIPEEPDPGVPFSIRVYRPDGSFATLSLSLNTTASEIVQSFAKKSLLHDDLDNYHIIVRRHDTSRQLDPGERPIAIQKRFLEQAGYKESDHIEELGREDHSYLVRFNFQHAKMSGYASLEKDPGFSKSQRLNNVDLSGRNLVTIPIALYKKCNEIYSINLSRNLSLEIPKDFIQSCSGLREIKFTANEASRLPPSFCLAPKLQYLDISNNRFEQLEHAPLDNLANLISLKISNNKLATLPQYLPNLRNLRHLNISSNNLSELPASLSELPTLVDLDVSFNVISALPNLGKMENLERLWATNNKLSGRLDDSMGELGNLREIDIRFNSIDNIDVCSKLPQLENLMAGHNSIAAFEGVFPKIRSLHLDHNPITRFDLESAVPTLSALNLASAKLSHLPDEIYEKICNVTKLNLDKNHLTALGNEIGRLQKLESLSIAKNSLGTLPPEIGKLFELKYFDARENNINFLPPELWFCRKLESLNLSANILDAFPKMPANIPGPAEQTQVNGYSPTTPTPEDSESFDKVGEMGPRRMSQVSATYNGSSNSSPAASSRKASISSTIGPTSRKPSMLSRASTDTTMSPISRKESMLANRVTATLSGSLRHLIMAENRLTDECFDQISVLQELRTLNLSYNYLNDIPSRTIRRFSNLVELYLSGNDLSCLPNDDLEEISALKILHINNNKFQVLPAELGKITKLAVLEASSNSLKYNVTNLPYDWNWNCNPTLKYLNLSANKRLEIKPAGNYSRQREAQNLTDFAALSKLRVLGLMDVTLMIPSVPDNTEDRRVRTSGSNIGSMAYGLADSLGRNEHLSTLDFAVPRLDGHEDEILFGLFDGVVQTNGGSKIVKFLQQGFEAQFKAELKQTKQASESPTEALRRTYLALNKDLASIALQPSEAKDGKSGQRTGSVISQSLTPEDLTYGCVATVMYVQGMDLFVSNVGDAQALLIGSEGSYRFLTEKHDPAEAKERQRIREAGGYVSRQGKLNDVLEVSRAFGYTQLMPAVIAAPFTSQVKIEESEETLLLASRELWDYLTPDFAVDLVRTERLDLMRAAQKLRDVAIAFGASGKITVMMIGVSDLRKKERAKYRTHSMSMGPSGLPDEYAIARRTKRGRDATLDSKLSRLDQEVDAPIGDVSLVFTDIKNSTLLWETYPVPMRAAIKMHNEVMRRHLRIIGGYEVKTEGDAFMVAFPTVTSALLWTFTIQTQLLEVQWPQEILNSVNGQEVTDAEGNVLFRGLSVRMGIHYGRPVCETDPVTRRMDYFGPMVNRAARISTVADGGQITVSSEFIAEVQRLLETFNESDQSESAGSEDQNEDGTGTSIRRELRSLSSHGFEVKELGERRLKGLENPEYIYLMYPPNLSGRLEIQQQRAEAEKALAEGSGPKKRETPLTVDLDHVWKLWTVSLRLEMLCSGLENPASTCLKPPETALLERTKERDEEITDRFLVNFVEHQISRIETCTNTLAIRNLVRPFKDGMLSQSGPMADIFKELSESLAELKVYREQNDIEMAPS